MKPKAPSTTLTPQANSLDENKPKTFCLHYISKALDQAENPNYKSNAAGAVV